MEHRQGIEKFNAMNTTLRRGVRTALRASMMRSNSHCIAMLREIVIARIKALSTAIAIACTKALSTAIAIARIKALSTAITAACIKALSVTTLLASVNPSCDKILRL